LFQVRLTKNVFIRQISCPLFTCNLSATKPDVIELGQTHATVGFTQITALAAMQQINYKARRTNFSSKMNVDEKRS